MLVYSQCAESQLGPFPEDMAEWSVAVLPSVQASSRSRSIVRQGAGESCDW